MSIKKKAFWYAIEKHGNQVRKAEREKPAIVHLIDVGNILEEYGFDENMIAAGYLHDILEDTDVSYEELLEEFGRDIYSLVVGASEEDRSLSWEERKLGTINRIKSLDFRHKAVILADKISNTDDLINLFGRTGKSDFSGFNRGKDKKLWYWREAYKSLILGQDESHPMFVRLKRNIDLIANDGLEKLDVCIFGREIENDLFLKKLYYKGLEILKLKNIQKSRNSYVACLLGDQCDSVLNGIKNYFEMFGLDVNYLNIFWSFEELRELSCCSDIDMFKTKIDERLRKIVSVIKEGNDLVFINSGFYKDMSELDKIFEDADVKVLKLLRYYLDVIDKLINNTYVLDFNDDKEFLGFYYNYFQEFLDSRDNVCECRISDCRDISYLCDLVVDSYKEYELCNIKKLIKEVSD